MSKLTAEPGTLEFCKQLLAIAEGSEHPMDKAVAGAMRKEIAKMEGEGEEGDDGS